MSLQNRCRSRKIVFFGELSSGNFWNFVWEISFFGILFWTFSWKKRSVPRWENIIFFVNYFSIFWRQNVRKKKSSFRFCRKPHEKNDLNGSKKKIIIEDKNANNLYMPVFLHEEKIQRKKIKNPNHPDFNRVF